MIHSRYYLDAVITMIDAKHILRHLESSGPLAFTRRRPEAEKQLALADRVILNKVDLVTPEELELVAAAVRRVNRSALMVRTSNAKVQLDQILGQRAFSSARWEEALEGKLLVGDVVHAQHGSTGVTCVCLRAHTDLVLDRVQEWMQALIARKHDDLYRVKGVLAIVGEDRRFFLHGVHAQVLGHFDQSVFAPGSRESTLVLIGNRLDALQLEQDFAQLANSSAPPAPSSDKACDDCDENEKLTASASEAQPVDAKSAEEAQLRRRPTAG